VFCGSQDKDPVRQAEIESDINYMQESGKLEFSMTICGSVLVSVYFAYEASLTGVFDYLATSKSLVSFDTYKKKQKERIKEEHGGKINFLVIAEEYTKEILKINLFGGNSYASVIEELRVLRNSYVHNGCSLDDLVDSTKGKIINGTYKNVLGHSDTLWYITPLGVSVFFKETYGSFKHFQRQAFHVAVT